MILTYEPIFLFYKGEDGDELGESGSTKGMSHNLTVLALFELKTEFFVQ